MKTKSKKKKTAKPADVSAAAPPAPAPKKKRGRPAAAPAAAPEAAPEAAPAAAPEAAPAPLNKTQLVLSMSKDIPAKEVVAAALAQGVEVSEQYVRVIRSNAKTKAKGPAKKRGRPAKAKAATAKPAKANGAHVNGAAKTGENSQFITLAIDMGLGNAEALLGRVRQAVVEEACLELARRAQSSLASRA